jgi:two-component system cell cycle sensor histidine kinase/response regulator CckA
VRLAPDETTFSEYTVQRPGAQEPQDRVAVITYFEPWDWVIVASMKRQEATQGGQRVIHSIALAVGVVLALALALLGGAVWAARKAAARIAAPFEALKQVLDNVGQGFLSMNSEGAISQERSAVVAEWFGEMAPGEPAWSYLGREDEEFARRMQLAWGALIKNSVPRGAVLAEMPSRLQRGEKTFDLAYRLVEAQGRIERIILVISDITTALANERSERQMRAELSQAQKMEAVGRLASGVAHDFNNLLVVILSCSQFLLEELPEGDHRRAVAEEIRRAGQRAARLVAQLLAFARKSPGHPVHTDLNAVVRAIESLVRRTIGEDIEVSFALAPDPWPLRIDPSQLEQVILNLAVNARDAMPNGGRLRIETANMDPFAVGADASELPGRSVILRVSDTGCGMTPEVLSKVFEPFFTTKEQGKGTGLGLSTVFGIVQQANGSVSVASEPWKGSTFTIHLPVCGAEAGAESSRESPRAVQGNGAAVLLVEDENGVREVASRVLSRRGFRVIEARNGAEALLRLDDAKVDLVLTDVVMPGISGPELAARLHRVHPQLPVVFMSGYTDRQGVWDGGTVVVPKPFTEETLLGRIDEALTQAHRARA